MQLFNFVFIHDIRQENATLDILRQGEWIFLPDITTHHAVGGLGKINGFQDHTGRYAYRWRELLAVKIGLQPCQAGIHTCSADQHILRGIPLRIADGHVPQEEDAECEKERNRDRCPPQAEFDAPVKATQEGGCEDSQQRNGRQEQADERTDECMRPFLTNGAVEYHAQRPPGIQRTVKRPGRSPGSRVGAFHMKGLTAYRSFTDLTAFRAPEFIRCFENRFLNHG